MLCYSLGFYLFVRDSENKFWPEVLGFIFISPFMPIAWTLLELEKIKLVSPFYWLQQKLGKGDTHGR